MVELDPTRYITTRISTPYQRGELCMIGPDLFIRKGYFGVDGIEHGLRPTGDPTLTATLIMTVGREVIAVHPDFPDAVIERRPSVLRALLLDKSVTILCGPLDSELIIEDDSFKRVKLKEP
ncbi:hypothetical protein KBD45_00850 [Candidatus Dojkabacteria bacterium]|nr:hypothetical protein [Candidatus Dojkabacteria bacterium]